MKTNIDYDAIFKECESYPEMLMAVTLRGGNKAKLNKFIQDKWKSCYDTSLGADPVDGMKTTLFVRQGYEFGEIPLRFVWNMLGCPKGLIQLKSVFGQ